MKDIISRQALWITAIGVVGIVYLSQAATPLRLDDDTVDYLRMAAAMTDGRAVPRLLPLGYPAFLSMLERARLGSSFYFVLANSFFLGAGLFALWEMMADYPQRVRRATLLFSLLSIPVIKSIPIALPEAAFFCASLVALWSITAGSTATGSKRFWLLASAFVCVAATVTIRTIGLALVPALILACARAPSARSDNTAKSPPRTWMIFAGLLGAALVVVVLRSEPFVIYQQWLRDYYWQGNAARQILRRITFVLSGLGEIVLNLPFSRFRDWRLAFGVVGGISLVGIAIGFRKARVSFNPLRLYLIGYVLVVAVWPNPSPRLWMPVIPLMIAEVGLMVSRLPSTGLKRPLLGTYTAWFALTGIAALAYTSRISFSGTNFERVYGRNGGMPTKEVDVTDPNWGHLQYYKAEATRMIARYGGKRERAR